MLYVLYPSAPGIFLRSWLNRQPRRHVTMVELGIDRRSSAGNCACRTFFNRGARGGAARIPDSASGERRLTVSISGETILECIRDPKVPAGDCLVPGPSSVGLPPVGESIIRAVGVFGRAVGVGMVGSAFRSCLSQYSPLS
eukprot:1594492-Rhodomonas_salina.1